MNGYRSMSCSTAKRLLPIMTYVFELTDDTLAGYTYHERVKTLETNEVIEKYRRSVNAMVSDSFPGQFLFNM